MNKIIPMNLGVYGFSDPYDPVVCRIIDPLALVVYGFFFTIFRFRVTWGYLTKGDQIIQIQGRE